MNGTPTPIEIFKPFGDAYELMKKMLFQPLDFSKWCVVGFAAFLAGNFGGGGFSGRFPNGSHGTTSPLPWHGPHDLHEAAPWIAVIVAVALVVLVLIFVLMWIRARGTFIFTDCIVHNRAAIKQPWHEYRREGNSFFLFSLAIGLISMLILAGIAGIFVLLFYTIQLPENQKTFLLVIFAIIVFFAWVVYAVVLGLISYFMPPVMYLRRCLALDAFRDLLRLVREHVASFVLFALFSCVLVLGLAIAGLILTCATCCMAAIPYVGTVLMLPALVWVRAFGLLFLRQFGPDYDVWRGHPPSPSASLPPPIPA